MNEIHFLNIDLDVESKKDIRPVVDHWGEKISVHRLEEVNGVWYGSFETWEGEENAIIKQYYDLVTTLPKSLRVLWDQAGKRDFDFGYEGGELPRSFHSRLSAKSLSMLAEIRGSVTITIYPAST